MSDAPQRRRAWLKWTAAAALVVTTVILVALKPIRRWLVSYFDKPYAAPAVSAPAVPPGKPRWVRVVKGLSEPTDIQFVPGDKRRAIVLEKSGTAKLLTVPEPHAKPSDATSAPVVVSLEVRVASELGLLGLALHPNYASNGLLYLNYNPKDGAERTVIAEYHLPLDRLGKQQATLKRKLLEVDQPYQNHDAGQLVFGPDGYLYIGLGDGGWRDDPHGNGQNLSTLLGSMLRVDVKPSADAPYTIPADNPFVGRDGARPEIWAYGLRNPWRYSFAPDGRLIVADVGQNDWEEVSIVTRGANMGWKVREGRHCFEPKKDCATDGLIDPIYEYGHELGKSITGGYVVTGDRAPSLKGKYVFGDFTDGRIWALTVPPRDAAPASSASAKILGRYPYLISTFGRDADGNVYLADYAKGHVLALTE